MAEPISSEDEALALRLEELKSALEEENFEEVVKLCEGAKGLFQDPALLPSKSGDDDDTTTTTNTLVATVYESYVKALLHLDQYTKVLDLACPSKECRGAMEPLQVYAMYRLEQYDRAIQTVDKILKSSTDKNATTDTATTAMLKHVRAQSMFNLADTSNALAAFEAKIQQAKEGNEDHGNDNLLMEAYTNAVAVLTANATPYDGGPQQQSAAARILLQEALDFCHEHTNEATPKDDEFELYPYDLAYNLATWQFLQADTAAKRQEASKLLQQAQRHCQVGLLTAGVPAKDVAREVKPMRSNYQWGPLFWGEAAPSTTAAPSSSTSASNKATKNNNANALLEQVNPVLVALDSISGSGKSQKTMDQAIQQLESLLSNNLSSKLSPLQKRLVRYNMAVLQLRSKQWDECRSTLDGLSQSLALSSSSKKKHKKKATTPTTTQQQQQQGDVGVIPTPSEADALWWQVRIEVLQAYSYLEQQNDSEEDNNAQPLLDAILKLQTRQEKIQTMLSSSGGSDDDQKMLEHTLLYLDLHLKELSAFSTSTTLTEEQFQWLQKEQTSKAYPAVTASLAKQYQDRNQPDKAREILLGLDKTSSNNGSGNTCTSSHIIAEMSMAQENYPEAVTLYEQALKTDPSNHSLRARLVEALSHTDPKRALEEWKRIEAEGGGVDDDEDDAEDAEKLEMMELPRIKSHIPSSSLVGVESSSGGVGQASSSKKKSKEAVLRRRAKLREAHLEKLQQKGLYNPSRPTVPDPERWIPKHERQRRRRRGGNQSKASQGGVSAKDAAKLDVAARASGAVDTTAGGRSTAHLNVAGGNRKGGRRR